MASKDIENRLLSTSDLKKIYEILFQGEEKRFCKRLKLLKTGFVIQFGGRIMPNSIGNKSELLLIRKSLKFLILDRNQAHMTTDRKVGAFLKLWVQQS